MTKRHAWIGIALAATAIFVGLAVLTSKAEGSKTQYEAWCNGGPGVQHAFGRDWISPCFTDEAAARRARQQHWIKNGRKKEHIAELNVGKCFFSLPGSR